MHGSITSGLAISLSPTLIARLLQATLTTRRESLKYHKQLSISPRMPSKHSNAMESASMVSSTTSYLLPLLPLLRPASPVWLTSSRTTLSPLVSSSWSVSSSQSSHTLLHGAFAADVALPRRPRPTGSELTAMNEGHRAFTFDSKRYWQMQKKWQRSGTVIWIRVWRIGDRDNWQEW